MTEEILADAGPEIDAEAFFQLAVDHGWMRRGNVVESCPGGLWFQIFHRNDTMVCYVQDPLQDEMIEVAAFALPLSPERLPEIRSLLTIDGVPLVSRSDAETLFIDVAD